MFCGKVSQGKLYPVCQAKTHRIFKGHIVKSLVHQPVIAEAYLAHVVTYQRAHAIMCEAGDENVLVSTKTLYYEKKGYHHDCTAHDGVVVKVFFYSSSVE